MLLLFDKALGITLLLLFSALSVSQRTRVAILLEDLVEIVCVTKSDRIRNFSHRILRVGKELHRFVDA
jgi:hypothetical protein